MAHFKRQRVKLVFKHVPSVDPERRMLKTKHLVLFVRLENTTLPPVELAHFVLQVRVRVRVGVRVGMRGEGKSKGEDEDEGQAQAQAQAQGQA